MNNNENLFDYLSTWWQQRQSLQGKPSKWTAWLPTKGNVVFTLLVLLLFFGAQQSGALPGQAIANTSTSTINYQGRLADSNGSPLTGFHNLEFRIYDVPVGGTSLWEELWTGGNAVQVSDGLFSVMLGSLNANLSSAISNRNELYLGITVDTDGEMVPRVQLGSVPFSMQASSVSDNSITTEKLASGAVTVAKLAHPAFATNNPGVDYSEEIDLSTTNYLPFGGFENTITITSRSQIFVIASANLILSAGQTGLYADLRRNGASTTPNTTRYTNSVVNQSNWTWNTVETLDPGTYTYQLYARATAAGARIGWYRPQVSILVIPIE